MLMSLAREQTRDDVFSFATEQTSLEPQSRVAGRGFRLKIPHVRVTGSFLGLY